jgi:hypothetical protein
MVVLSGKFRRVGVGVVKDVERIGVVLNGDLERIAGRRISDGDNELVGVAVPEERDLDPPAFSVVQLGCGHATHSSSSAIGGWAHETVVRLEAGPNHRSNAPGHG